MHVAARLAWETIDWGTPQTRALVTAALPPALAVPDWHDPPAPRPDAAADFLADLRAEQGAQGERWQALQQPGARAVVTGQQPGCAGGVLLTLYKAATAIAVAQRLQARLDRPVVPVFWNATDDEDFDEIASVGWPGPNGLVFLELPRAGRRAGGWVGDLPAQGDEAAARAALALVPESEGAALAALLPAGAADHGTWVAALLGRVFPELAILDARSPALRRHGARLFEAYLRQHPAAVAAVAAGTAAVTAAGFAPTLAAGSARAALFDTAARQRRKVGDDPEPLLERLRERPEDLSPNVVLRPLLQDVLLPVVAHVVGPSEVGYLLELRGLRRLLDVPVPALVPRLTCTVVGAAAWDGATAAGIAPEALVRDPQAALQAVAQRASAPRRAHLATLVAGLETQLRAASLSEAVLAKSVRRLEALHGEWQADLDDQARAALVERTPELATLPPALRPRGRPQERVVAALWLLAQWGGTARTALLELASAHLEGLEARRGEHFVVVP
jgi:uncharacterized protein YllA (UPF0747 family)